MSDIDPIVSVTITAETLTPEETNFGLPLIAGYFPTTVFPERVRTYSSPTEMVADGFAATDPIVRAANRLIQNPKVAEFKIGRRALPMSQDVRLTPNNTTEGFVVTVQIVSPDGTTTTVSRTNGAAETPTTIATALQPLIDAITDLTATDNTGSVSAAADNAGELFDFRAIAGLAVLDETPDPGIATDLAAIEAEDSSWYGLGLDSNSKAEIAAAAAWAEALTKIAGFSNADEEVLDDTAGNIAETLEAAAYDRSYFLWNRAVLSYAGIAWMGDRFPSDPGSSTWKFKQLSGITVDKLSTTQKNNLTANNANFYISIASIPTTCEGTMASGRFIDITRTIDAFVDQTQVELFQLLSNLPKLPYTNASVSLVKSVLRGVIREFQGDQALDPETEPVITAPLVQDVSSVDRGNRLLPDINFSARLAGAIHSIQITGVLAI